MAPFLWGPCLVFEASAVAFGHESFTAADFELLHDVLADEWTILTLFTESLQNLARVRNIQADVFHVVQNTEEALSKLINQSTIPIITTIHMLINPHICKSDFYQSQV